MKVNNNPGNKFFALRIFFCTMLVISGFMVGGSAPVERGERILDFHSEITINRDASMIVKETIQVASLGIEIKRGIFRDFPTRYKDRYGNSYNVDFDVLEVTRDGLAENYRITEISNGKRVRIGNENVFLAPGRYTYTITYRTDRQMGFFEDHDELYWNVTGTGWNFPIEKASATVVLPGDVPVGRIQTGGYTGVMGSRESDCKSSIDSSGFVHFYTTRELNPHEGLTIVASWPKGYVSEPSDRDKLLFFIRDNRSVFVGFIGLLVLAIYYGMIWAAVGKDPAKGTIIPLYEPPEELTPAAMRYIVRMGFDHKTFAAAIVNMAVKGYLTIQEEDHVYTLIKGPADETVLSPDEKKIAARLNLNLFKELDLLAVNNAVIRNSMEALKRTLKTNYEKNYFITNAGYFALGLLISIAVMIATGFSLPALDGKGVFLFMSVWLTGWSVGVTFLLFQVFNSWKQAVGKGFDIFNLIGALFLSLFAIPFLAGEIFGIIMLLKVASPFVVVILAGVVLLNILFYHLLKAPTYRGRKILDKIEGFKMYLSVAEKDRLRMFDSPEKTPELFERYLPYALALDVEQAWAEQFSGVLARAGTGSGSYSPAWYSGAVLAGAGAAGFVNSFGSSFSSAISSSSTPPGSRSGGGGGGSSGGGGGGGGGGGW